MTTAKMGDEDGIFRLNRVTSILGIHRPIRGDRLRDGGQRPDSALRSGSWSSRARRSSISSTSSSGLRERTFLFTYVHGITWNARGRPAGILGLLASGLETPGRGGVPRRAFGQLRSLGAVPVLPFLRASAPRIPVPVHRQAREAVVGPEPGDACRTSAAIWTSPSATTRPIPM